MMAFFKLHLQIETIPSVRQIPSRFRPAFLRFHTQSDMTAESRERIPGTDLPRLTDRTRFSEDSQGGPAVRQPAVPWSRTTGS